jgi:hypothetical protein
LEFVWDFLESVSETKSGMMQVAFIWYHLFNVSSTYNLIRVFVTSYVWMTGFGNFIFFQSKKDFSLLRILKVVSLPRLSSLKSLPGFIQVEFPCGNALSGSRSAMDAVLYLPAAYCLLPGRMVDSTTPSSPTFPSHRHR